MSTSIALTSSSSDTVVGSTVHTDGVLQGKSGISGARISLKVTLPDGTVKYPSQGPSTYTTTGGAFSFDYTPTVAGKHQFTATYAGNFFYPKATKMVSFDVAAAPTTGGSGNPQSPSDGQTPVQGSTSMTLIPASSTIVTGNALHADGGLKSDASVSGVTVSLSVTLPDGSTAYPTQGATVVTDASGKFAADYVPTKAGTYKLTATYAGSEQSDAVSASASFTVSDPISSASFKYVVTSSGGTYTAKNSATGATIASGTNAATVIQSAMNALTSGRTVKEGVLLQGDFVLTSSLKIPSYTILKLDGKVTMGTNANTHMVEASSKSNFDIIGGEWNGNQANQNVGGTATRGFDFSSCSYVTIKDLSIHDIAYDNIACVFCDHVTVSNCNIYNAGNFARGDAWYGHGLGMYYSNDCTIEGCHIYDCASGGCYFYCEDDGRVETVNNNVMRNNIVERTRTSGLSISLRGPEDKGSNNVIEGNTLIDCGIDGEHPGINLGWSDRTTNRMADHCTIQNNVIYETGNYYSAGGVGGGIDVCCDYSIITNNVVHDTTDVGIGIAGDYNTISNNQVSNVKTTFYPALLMYDANHNEVVGNTFSNCVYGITMHAMGSAGCSNNHIANNKFVGMSGYVIAIYESSSVSNVIENDTFVSGSSILNSGTSTVIRSNTVS